MAAKKFGQLIGALWTEVFGTQQSAGATNAGDIVALDDTGYLHKSLIPALSARLRPVFQNDFLTIQAQLDWLTLGAFSSGDNGFLVASTQLLGRHYGVMRFRSGTTANGGCRVTTSSSALVIQGGEQFDVVFQSPSSFISTQILRFGFLNTSSAAAVTDGAYFNVDGTGQVTCVNVNSSSSTSSSVLGSLSTATWYNAKVIVAGDKSSINFILYEDDGDVLMSHSLTTNIPGLTSRTGLGFVAHSTGTTAADLCALDYMGFSVPDIARGSAT